MRPIGAVTGGKTSTKPSRDISGIGSVIYRKKLDFREHLRGFVHLYWWMCLGTEVRPGKNFKILLAKLVG